MHLLENINNADTSILINITTIIPTLYSQGDWWFNLLIGSLNIGVWVFFRNIGDKKWDLVKYLKIKMGENINFK